MDISHFLCNRSPYLLRVGEVGHQLLVTRVSPAIGLGYVERKFTNAGMLLQFRPLEARPQTSEGLARNGAGPHGAQHSRGETFQKKA